MRCTTKRMLTRGMVLFVLAAVISPALAERHVEALEEELESIQERIESYEEHDREAPAELVAEEEEIIAALEAIRAEEEEHEEGPGIEREREHERPWHEPEEEENHERLNHERLKEEAEEILDELEAITGEIEALRRGRERVPVELTHEAAQLLDEIEVLLREEEALRPMVARRWMEAFSPVHLERMERVRRREPAHYERILQDVLPHLLEMQRLRLEHPERFALERVSFQLNLECEHLANRLRWVRGTEERDEVIGQLRDKLRELFRVRLEMREMEIRRLERELEELRGHVKRMREDAEGMVDRRLNSLISEGERW